MKAFKKLIILTCMLILAGINFTGSAQGMKIKTGHPDLKVKVTRCEASDDKVYIDLIFENASENDTKLKLQGSRDWIGSAFDDESNSYGNGGRGLISVSLNNAQLSDFEVESPFLEGAPIKGRIVIDGVPESAKEFTRINIGVECRGLGLGRGNFIKFFNVPIYREGDE